MYKIPLTDLETLYPTMDDVQYRMSSLFGERDDKYRPNFSDRSNLLIVGLTDLSKTIFRDVGGQESLEVGTARLTARVFSIAHWSGGLSVSESLSSKFPVEGCGYCGSKPCICAVDRDRSKPAADLPLSYTRNWSIRQWQDHLAELYGNINIQELEVKGVYIRLLEEFAELIEYVEQNEEDGNLAHKDLGFKGELADLSAWTLSLASMINVDVQKAILERFGNGCPVCGNFKGCNCGKHNIKPVKLA